MSDFPSKEFDNWLTNEPVNVCEVCGEEEECTEDCECEDCLQERAERHHEGMMDTYD